MSPDRKLFFNPVTPGFYGWNGVARTGRFAVPTRGVLALVAGIIFALALHVAGLLAGINISRNVLLLVSSIFILLILVIDKISIRLARRIVSSYEPARPAIPMEASDYPEKSMFLLESFIKTITKPIIEINNIYILIASDREPILGFDVIRAKNEKWGSVFFFEEHDAIYMLINKRIAYKILDIIYRGDGDKLVIADESELLLIYNMIKDIYKARYLVFDPVLLAYTAYKTILMLINDDILDVPENLLGKLPNEPPVVRDLVNEQLRLELE
ncbi:MAG: hypothetical protein GSR73_02345 [Desulfurococcales archaeon]|nr:hypothetical protein [Desulfurococcales archaeon]